VPAQLIHVREREAADIDVCVQALAAVHESSGYPSVWPADPARWLTPSRSLRAWVAATGEIPLAGHVVVRQPPPGAASAPVAEVSRQAEPHVIVDHNDVRLRRSGAPACG
jgi:hypothetical protein